jgi:hypothetical protein
MAGNINNFTATIYKYWVSDELQGNQVTISRVYPCILYLQSELTNNFEKLKYTKDLRLALLDSLNRRF